ncbi:MAG: class I SAM-dependent methyltransferase, partial [Rhodobacteraceae bacterium]|nr:class I SAM-dependent methyltransferase [Paracoccaceae bacterium]
QKWPELSEDKLLNLIRKEIVQQSDRFNKFRNFDADAYGKRDLSILAYGNFYYPRTWTAMSFAMAEALHVRGWSPPKKGPVRILDLGSGTGASGLSCLHFLQNQGIQNHMQLEAVDYSSKSLVFVKKVHAANRGLWPDSRISTTRMDLNFPFDEKNRKRYDLILLGYSLNELLDEEGDDSNYRQLLSFLPSLLKNNGLAIITEPAQAEICHTLHQNCAKLTKEDANVFLHAPYFNGICCPLADKKSKYFSHEVRKMSPPSVMEKINRPLNLEIREVKFGLSMIGANKPQDLGHGQQVCRIISPIKKRKGTVSFIGMASDGEEYTYEFQRRDLQKEELNDLLCLTRGDILT